VFDKLGHENNVSILIKPEKGVWGTYQPHPRRIWVQRHVLEPIGSALAGRRIGGIERHYGCCLSVKVPVVGADCMSIVRVEG